MKKYKQTISAAKDVGETQIMSVAITGKKQPKKQKPETPAGSGVASASEGVISRQRKTLKPIPIHSRIPLYHSLTISTAGQERRTPATSAATSTPKVNKSKRRKVIKPWNTMVSKLARVQPQSRDALLDAPVESATVGGTYCRDLSTPLFTTTLIMF